MATVIDSLVVQLGLDASKFKKGVKESGDIQDDFEKKSTEHTKKKEEIDKKGERETERRHRELVRQHKETLEGFKRMREGLISFLLIFTAGKEIGDFVSETIRSSVAIGQLSDNIGMNEGRLAGWQVAMKETGGAAEDMDAAIKKAASIATHQKAGIDDEGVKGLFTAAGGTGVDLTHAFDNAESVLMAQVAVLEAKRKMFPEGSQAGREAVLQAAEYMKISERQLELEKLGVDEVMKRVQNGQKLAGVNKAQTSAAEKAMKDWTDIITKLQSIGKDIMFPMLDAVSKWLGNKENIKALMDGLTKMADSIKQINFEALLEGLTLVAKVLIMALDGLSQIMGILTSKEFLPGVKNAFKGVFPSGPAKDSTLGGLDKILSNALDKHAAEKMTPYTISGTAPQGNPAQLTVNVNGVPTGTANVELKPGSTETKNFSLVGNGNSN